MIRDISELKYVYILGAGFSKNLGLPLQSEFTNALVKPQGKGNDKIFGSLLSWIIKRFIRLSFHSNLDRNISYCPRLEDLFTCIGLSANTGINLGRNRSPAYLRTIRRIFIARIIQTVNEVFNYSKIMRTLLNKIDFERSIFFVMNWDTSLEKAFIEKYKLEIESINYVIDCLPLKRTERNSESDLNIIKLHGSTNWLYCDCCRGLFCVGKEDERKIPYQLLKAEDWDRIKKFSTLVDEYGENINRFRTPKRVWQKLKCPSCVTLLSTRLATFSYRKDITQPFFQYGWYLAEQCLISADKWVFIGYSLPDADYEFKHILKRAQLIKRNKLDIKVVVNKNSDNFKDFFGSRLKDKNIVLGGLRSYIEDS